MSFYSWTIVFNVWKQNLQTIIPLISIINYIFQIKFLDILKYTSVFLKEVLSFRRILAIGQHWGLIFLFFNIILFLSEPMFIVLATLYSVHVFPSPFVTKQTQDCCGEHRDQQE